MSLFLLWILNLSCDAKLPERLAITEIFNYYKPVESQGLRLKDYGLKGFGFELTKDVDPGGVVLCIDRSQKLSAFETYDLSNYVESLDEVTQLKIRVLYHKFMSNSSDYFTLYIKSMSNNFFHFGSWNSFQRELFSNLTLTNFSEDPTGMDEYLLINSALSEVDEIPAEMLEYESYMWANYVVKSRFFTYNDPEGDYFVMIPVLDVPNHYPNPSKYRDSSFFTYTEEEDCLNTFWPRKAGDEFLFQYSIHNAFVFFTGYDIVLENNPYDYFDFYVRDRNDEEKNFELYADSTNLELLEVLLENQGKKVETEEDFRMTWLFCPVEDEPWIVRALVLYREKVSEYEESWKNGLREVRRMKGSNDYVTGRILAYAEVSRVTFYHHLRAVDQDLLYAIHFRLLRI